VTKCQAPLGVRADLERTIRRWVRVREVSFGTFAFARGLAYLLTDGDRLPHAVLIISNVVPVQVWAWLWILSGCCMYLSAVRYLSWATYPTVGMCGVWLVGYLLSAIGGFGDQSPLLAALTFLLFALVIVAGTVIVSIALKLCRIVYPGGGREP
jgi:hypothetical protein